MLKLKDRGRMPGPAEVERLFRQYLKDSAGWEKERLAPKIRLKVTGPVKDLRPVWHFLAAYGGGKLSVGRTEDMSKRGRTIHNPGLWLRVRQLNLRNRGAVRLHLKSGLNLRKR